jgi:hypothetical protein
VLDAGSLAQPYAGAGLKWDDGGSGACSSQAGHVQRAQGVAGRALAYTLCWLLMVQLLPQGDTVVRY